MGIELMTSTDKETTPTALLPPYTVRRGGYDVEVHTYDIGTLTAITVGRITDNKFWQVGSRGDLVTRHVLAITKEILDRESKAISH